ncbi:GIY-YIG nuclease family protein [uncultured Cyclobacterium sp.]|uniref:GIY-YIG nuclease family protein n=1 Tax=uncultured Cyclobacterium sp. TaxID=453820 RepID=UPI0030EB141F
MEQFFVYIIYSEAIDKFYVGQTGNIDNRLLFHNDSEKNNIWTKRGIPWVLKTSIPFNSRTDALKAEKFIKKQKSRKLILDIIQNGYIK